MTANQQHNNNLASKESAQFNAGRIPLRMEADKSFFESLNDNRAYHCVTQNKMTTSSKNLDSRYEGSLTAHEPSPQALDGTISSSTKNTVAELALKAYLPQRFDTTGCSVVSAASFNFENLNVMLRTTNGATINVSPAKLSPEADWISKPTSIAHSLTRTAAPPVTTDQAALSSLTKTNYHHSSHRLSS